MSRPGGLRLWVALGALVMLHFALRPALGDNRYAPDFVLVALVLYAMNSRPGVAAVAGFVVGVVHDATAPTAFGAAALAHTLAAYLASWTHTVFVADNVLVTAAFVAGAAWLRDVVQALAANQLAGSALLWQLSTWSVLAAAATAVAALVLLLAVRGWVLPRSLR
ncbi:MAG TPA: rod shape-determining protein MreD [Gemmatimonadales bacterium]|nr:rod shape-determining protein MreD [Gemmatimonadales bacterium]